VINIVQSTREQVRKRNIRVNEVDSATYPYYIFLKVTLSFISVYAIDPKFYLCDGHLEFYCSEKDIAGSLWGRCLHVKGITFLKIFPTP